jgi:hypothetical protein
MVSLPTDPRLAAAAAPVLGTPQTHASGAAKKLVLVSAHEAVWQRYLEERGWISASAYHSAAQQTQLAALALHSAALTFPLTIARCWERLFSLRHSAHDRWLHLCVVGARAEAALPVDVWSDLMLLTGCQRLRIDFYGPAAAPEGVPAEREWIGAAGQRLMLSIASGELFHLSRLGQSMLARGSTTGDVQSLPDAFALFDPGCSEPGWERAWEPTLRALFASGCPVLMTALSTSDGSRDEAFINSLGLYGKAQPIHALEPYNANPFSSLLSASGKGLAVNDAANGAANSVMRVVHPLRAAQEPQ